MAPTVPQRNRKGSSRVLSRVCSQRWSGSWAAAAAPEIAEAVIDARPRGRHITKSETALGTIIMCSIITAQLSRLSWRTVSGTVPGTAVRSHSSVCE